MLWSIKGVLNDSPAEQWGNMCHLGFFSFSRTVLIYSIIWIWSVKEHWTTQTNGKNCLWLKSKVTIAFQISWNYDGHNVFEIMSAWRFSGRLLITNEWWFTYDITKTRLHYIIGRPCGELYQTSNNAVWNEQNFAELLPALKLTVSGRLFCIKR